MRKILPNVYPWIRRIIAGGGIFSLFLLPIYSMPKADLNDRLTSFASIAALDDTLVSNIRTVLPLCLSDSVKVSFEAGAGLPPFQYSLDGGNTYSPIFSVDSVTQSGNSALHFNRKLPGGTYTILLKDVADLEFPLSEPFTVAPNSPSSTPSSDTLFVKTEPSGIANGSSWDNAFDGHLLGEYLQSTYPVEGVKIFLAEGTYIPYFEGCDDSASSRSHSFELNKQDIEFSGGYSKVSTGSDLTAYDPKNQVTRLSGEIQNDNDAANNSYHVILIGNGINATLKGLFISDGNADGQGIDQNGGGIYDMGGGSFVNVSQVVLENNNADYGAGAYFNGNTRTILDSIVIRNNTSLIGFGGALFAWGDFALLNSTVTQNSSDGIVSWGGDIGIRNSTITGNTRSGVFAENPTSQDVRVAIVSTTITNNTDRGIRLNNEADGFMHFHFNNSLIVNNHIDLDFTGNFPVDTLLFQYSIVGNTKYIRSFQDAQPLPIPVSLGTLADNGGWGETQALLDVCENPAVHAGDTALLSIDAAKYDQRGVLRKDPPSVGAYDGVEGTQIGFAITPDDTACMGSSITIVPKVTLPAGNGINSYQWYKNGIVISNETDSILVFNDIQLSDTGKYSVFVATDDATCSRMSDSVSITVFPTHKDSSNAAICQGDNYLWRTKTLAEAGIYTDSLQTINGCDSIFILNLIVNPVYKDSSGAAICQGDSYLWRAQTLTVAGIYTDSLQTINGCDSIFILNLIVNPVYKDSSSAAICQGDSYLWRTQTLTAAGIYTDSLQTINGCDSIFILNLIVNPVYKDSSSAAICQGDSYLWRTQTLTAVGIYTDSLQTTNGCDSIFILNLIINDLPVLTSVKTSDSTCSNSPVGLDLIPVFGITTDQSDDSLQFSQDSLFTKLIATPESYSVNPDGDSTVYVRALNRTTGCVGTSFLTLNYKVNRPVNITVQPSGGMYGSVPVLSVMVTATNPSYQWYKDGNSLESQTGTNYSVREVGAYYVVVTNSCGSVNSDTVKITKAQLVVTAKDTSVSYGFNPETFVGQDSITGFVNGETRSVLIQQPLVELAPGITSATAPGIYPDSIRAGGAVATNYDFSYINGAFTINPVITASAIGNGSITPSGNITVTYANNQTFTFTPEAGYRIAEVLADGIPQPEAIASGSYTFTQVTANHTLSVSFETAQFTIVATSGPNGSISPSGNVSVDAGGSQTFLFLPDEHYSVFLVWVDGVYEPDAILSYTFSNVSANHTIFVEFEHLKHTIFSSVAGGNGTILPSGDTLLDEGTNMTYTIIPDANYEINSILVDGVNDSTAVANGNYIFFNIMTSHTIVATFKNTVGLPDNKLASFKLYPNPTTGELTVESGKSSIGKLEIVTLTGELVFVQDFGKQTIAHISITNWPKGIYFIRTNGIRLKLIKN